MQSQRRWIPGVLFLLLATGCRSVGVGRSADIPVTKPYPLPHPPDAGVTSRETETRLDKRLNVLSVKMPPIDWALLGLAIVF